MPTHRWSNNDARLFRRLRVWQCHRARNEVERGRGGGLVCGGGWALERSIGKTACGLDGGEEETGREGETDGLTALSRNGSLLESRHYVRGEARHCRSGAVCGGCSEAESRHCLRQQPIGLPPGRPEHFRRGLPRRRCGGIAARYNQAVGLPRSGGTGLF